MAASAVCAKMVAVVVDHLSRQERAVPTVQVFRFVECTFFYLTRNQRCEVLHKLLDKIIGVRQVQIVVAQDSGLIIQH